MVIPVKPINEIEVKSEVSENDKILILDSESEEARLASKDELKGDKGDQWNPWQAATLNVWTTTTGAAWTNASVTNSGTTSAAVFDFTIPKGDKGDKGTDAWEYMTQAQYDALPSSKLTDWVSRMVYSDEERFFKTALRAASNLLHYNNQDELYADLQLENWMTPTTAFPIWVNVWNVSSSDWWEQSWVLVNALASSGSYMRRLYGDDWKLYFDWGTGVFSQMLTSDDISWIIQTLRSELAEVAFTGKSSDLNNDAEFTADKVMTMEEYEQIPWTAGDDKNYWIFENEN